MPLTTVTIVVEFISAVPVGESEFEVDSKGAAEVEEIWVVLEKVEVFRVVGMGVGEDVNINVDIVGVALVGVDGSDIATDNDIDLVYVVKKRSI